jgi:HEPN domain-containing protein
MPEHTQARRTSAFQNEALLEMDMRGLRAYEAALSSFNAGNWDAAIIACGKAMEEIAKSQLPYNERNGSLAHLLERLPKHLKLEQPMAELASAIKDGKSLGGHFDLEKTSNAEIAQATLSLLESYINYVYLFKAKVAYLIELVERGASATATPPTVQEATEEKPAPAPARHGDAGREEKADDSPFDSFSNRDPYDIRSSHWNLGDKED